MSGGWWGRRRRKKELLARRLAVDRKLQGRLGFVIFAAALAAGGAAGGTGVVRAEEKAKAGGPVSFHKQIRPILQSQCQGCHQPAKAGGKLVLTSYAGLAKGGEQGDTVVAGEAEGGGGGGENSGGRPGAADRIGGEPPPVYRVPPVISALVYAPDGKTLAVSG